MTEEIAEGVEVEPIDGEPEVPVEPVEPVEPVAPPEDEPEFTEEEMAVIARAAEKAGYNPNYDGPNKKSPVDYIVDKRDIQKTLTETLRDSRRYTDTIKKDVEHIVSYVQKQAQERVSTLEAKVKALQEEREEAVRDADVDRFKEVEQDLADTTKALNGERAVVKPATEAPNAEFDTQFSEWKTANPWFGTDAKITRYAQTFKSDPKMAGLPDAEYLAAIEAEVKDAFPHNFEAKKPPAPSRVAGAGNVRRGPVPSPTASETGLSYQQKQMLDDYERNIPDFDRKKYVQELLGRGK